MAPKRPASGSAAAAKKAKTVSGIDAIAKAVNGAPGLPADVSAMVSSMLPLSLPTYQDQRHQFQTNAVQFAGDCLAALEAAMAAKLESTSLQVSDAPAEKVRRDEALTSAVAASEAAKHAAKESKVQLVERKAEAKAAQVKFKEAETQQKNGDKELVTLEGSQKKLETLQARIGKQEVSAVKELKPFGLDASLLNAAPASIASSSPSSFDIVVKEQLDKAIVSKFQEYSATLEAAAPARAERAAAVSAGKAAQDAAESAHEQAIKANLEATANHSAAEDALISARAAVANYAAELRQTAMDSDNAREDLSTFRSAVLAVFYEMRDRNTPKEPEDEPKTVDSVLFETAAAAVDQHQ